MLGLLNDDRGIRGSLVCWRLGLFERIPLEKRASWIVSAALYFWTENISLGLVQMVAKNKHGMKRHE